MNESKKTQQNAITCADSYGLRLSYVARGANPGRSETPPKPGWWLGTRYAHEYGPYTTARAAADDCPRIASELSDV